MRVRVVERHRAVGEWFKGYLRCDANSVMAHLGELFDREHWGNQKGDCGLRCDRNPHNVSITLLRDEGTTCVRCGHNFVVNL